MKCNAPAGSCDCWTKCRCGWSYEAGGARSNPAHACEDAAQQAADFIAASVVGRMRDAYPEPMRYASGGFAKTLKASITSEARAMVLEILNADPRTTRAE